jgi:hypothetical protein
MGRLIKNTQITAGSHSIQLPSGPTATRPSTAVNGQIRYNTTTSKFEYYENGSYYNLAHTGNVAITTDGFTGNGGTVFGPMVSTVSDAKSVLVFVGGVHQNPATAFTVNGSSYITFTGNTPGVGTSIVIYHGFDSTSAS